MLSLWCGVPVTVQLSDLKRLLLDKDQVLQEYEYERGQMQRRMEELGQRLADKSSSLEGSRSVSASGCGVLPEPAWRLSTSSVEFGGGGDGGGMRLYVDGC